MVINLYGDTYWVIRAKRAVFVEINCETTGNVLMKYCLLMHDGNAKFWNYVWYIKYNRTCALITGSWKVNYTATATTTATTDDNNNYNNNIVILQICNVVTVANSEQILTHLGHEDIGECLCAYIILVRYRPYDTHADHVISEKLKHINLKALKPQKPVLWEVVSWHVILNILWNNCCKTVCSKCSLKYRWMCVQYIC